MRCMHVREYDCVFVSVILNYFLLNFSFSLAIFSERFLTEITRPRIIQAWHITTHHIASHCQYGMSDRFSGISIEIGGKRETKHSLYDEKRSFGPFLFPPKHDGRLGSSLFRISSNSISHMAAATDILGCRTFQPIQLYHIIFRNLSSN